jgi:hypothetical protein
MDNQEPKKILLKFYFNIHVCIFKFAHLADEQIQNKEPNFKHLKTNQNSIPLVKVSLALNVDYGDEIQFSCNNINIQFLHVFTKFCTLRPKLTSISFLRTDLIS